MRMEHAAKGRDGESGELADKPPLAEVRVCCAEKHLLGAESKGSGASGVSSASTNGSIGSKGSIGRAGSYPPHKSKGDAAVRPTSQPLPDTDSTAEAAH